MKHYIPDEVLSHPDLGGEQRIYKFANGYSASVVRHSFSYGGREGKWELAVIGQDGSLDYTTPITSDVIGHLEEGEVDAILEKIEKLPNPAVEAVKESIKKS